MHYMDHVCSVSTVVKRRVVKLIVNFLFYFRPDEDEVSVSASGPDLDSIAVIMCLCFSPPALCCWNSVAWREKTSRRSPSVRA